MGDAVVRSIARPPQSLLGGLYPRVDLADSYAATLPPDASDDPDTLARFLFAQRSAWIAALMRLRDALVAPLGLKTASSLQAGGDGRPRIGIFRIVQRTPGELVLGEDDRHLDFRLSVLCQPMPDDTNGRQLVVSTVVHCHNATGRIYLAVIAPFHRRIVRAVLRRGARQGWPGKTA